MLDSSSISEKEGNNAGADDQDLMKASLKQLRGLTTYICEHLKRVTQTAPKIWQSVISIFQKRISVASVGLSLFWRASNTEQKESGKSLDKT